MDKFSIIMTTCRDAVSARPIIDALLGEGLAACIQVLPIQSHYVWDGEVQHEGEALLLIKGRADCYGEIEAAILRLHDYELPEIIQVPIEGGLGGYLSWLADPSRAG